MQKLELLVLDVSLHKDRVLELDSSHFMELELEGSVVELLLQLELELLDGRQDEVELLEVLRGHCCSDEDKLVDFPQRSEGDFMEDLEVEVFLDELEPPEQPFELLLFEVLVLELEVDAFVQNSVSDVSLDDEVVEDELLLLEESHTRDMS